MKTTLEYPLFQPLPSNLPWLKDYSYGQIPLQDTSFFPKNFKVISRLTELPVTIDCMEEYPCYSMVSWAQSLSFTGMHTKSRTQTYHITHCMEPVAQATVTTHLKVTDILQKKRKSNR